MRSALIAAAACLATSAFAQSPSQVPYAARALTPAHGDLARSAGVPARLANESVRRGIAPVVDDTRQMYDKDYFMLPNSPNGRNNIGTVSLDANELNFGPDGSLVLHISHEPPADADARANWLPAPEGQFAILRAYVPTQPVLDGGYRLPNVEREAAGSAVTIGAGRP